MKIFLKRWKYSAQVCFLYFILPTTLFAMFQTDPVPGDTSEFPYILLLPYLIGIIVHWYKNYQLGGVQVNFFSYMFTDLAGTIISLVVGIGSLVGMYAVSGHGGLFPVTIASWLTAFYVGIGADTINSGMSTKPTPPTV